MVGYPRPRIATQKYIKEKFGLETVVGTHPFRRTTMTPTAVGHLNSESWQETIKDVICDEEMRRAMTSEPRTLTGALIILLLILYFEIFLYIVERLIPSIRDAFYPFIMKTTYF